MHEILIALAILALWAGFVWLSPTRRCPSGPCPACKGSGRRLRPGARLVRRGINRGREHAGRELREQRARRRGPHDW
jgi:hypothetical protein